MKKIILALFCLTILIISCRKAIIIIRNHQNSGGKDTTGVIKIDSVTVKFPIGTIDSRDATLKRVVDADLQEDFNLTLELFRVGVYDPNQIILNVGPEQPLTESTTITFILPPEMIPSNYSWQVFAKTYQDGGEEILDHFELLPSLYNATQTELTAVVPAYVFTNKRNKDSTYEAIFQLATVPGPAQMSFTPFVSSAATADQCMAGQIGCPLGGFDLCTSKVTSPFGVRTHPVTGQTNKPHRGVDFGVGSGTPVYAVADGKIETVYTEHYKNGTVKGFGLYVVVNHSDGSSTLYAHLQSVSVKKGDPVKVGQQLALSDNSGTTTNPHLHFEYVPNGEIVGSKSQIDPYPCISDNAQGSITVNDNGNLADDAFKVYLDGIFIGQTDIGQMNTFALSNLIPGDRTLKLLCYIAPDNVGTYEVLLGDGITFKEDGTDYRSGVLAENASTSWTINIPASATALLIRPSSKPNKHIER